MTSIHLEKRSWNWKNFFKNLLISEKKLFSAQTKQLALRLKKSFFLSENVFKIKIEIFKTWKIMKRPWNWKKVWKILLNSEKNLLRAQKKQLALRLKKNFFLSENFLKVTKWYIWAALKRFRGKTFALCRKILEKDTSSSSTFANAKKTLPDCARFESTVSCSSVSHANCYRL